MDGNKQVIMVAAAGLVVGLLVPGPRAGAQSAARDRSTPAAAAAKRRSTLGDRTVGLSLGAYTLAATGVSVTRNDADASLTTTMGEGAGVMIGWGFNPRLTGFVSLDIARQGSGQEDIGGSFGLAHFEFGARLNLPMNSQTTLPYLSLSMGRRAIGAKVQDFADDVNFDMTLSGGMFGVGGGIQRFISPHTALEGGVEIGFGRFGHLDLEGQQGPIDVNPSTSTRLHFGVNWRP